MIKSVFINIVFLFIFVFVLLKIIQIGLDVRRRHVFVLFENISRLGGILEFVRFENKTFLDCADQIL